MNESTIAIGILLLFACAGVDSFSHDGRGRGRGSSRRSVVTLNRPLTARLARPIDARRPASSRRHTAMPPLRARERSKWDDLVDEDDDDDCDDEPAPGSKHRASAITISDSVPPDMLCNEANVRRQAETYDRLEAIGGRELINDVYVRATEGREWWLVGKVARISGTMSSHLLCVLECQSTARRLLAYHHCVHSCCFVPCCGILHLVQC